MDLTNSDHRKIHVKPLSELTWPDLEQLFGPKGAYGGCWCMWWHKTRSKFSLDQGLLNKESLQELAGGQTPPGIIGYLD